MATKITSKQTRAKIRNMLNLFADTVAVTMGPNGQNVLMENDSKMSIITKDGVTVANSIKPGEPENRMITDIIKQAADKTNREAGDGTTTATVLTRSIFEQGLQMVTSGYSVTKLKSEVEEAKDKMLSFLDTITQEVSEEKSLETLKHIAKISLSGDDKLSGLVADAVNTAGKYGVVKIQENNVPETVIEKEEGLTFRAGYLNPFFCDNRDEDKVTFENCYVFITSHKLVNSNQLKLLEKALNPLIKQGAPLLIISSECGDTFLSNLMANHKSGNFKNCPIRPPYWTMVRKEFYTDLAALTGATVVEAEEGTELDQVKTEHFGFAKKVEVTSMDTTIIGGKGDESILDSRIQTLKEQAEKVDLDNDLDKVHERLAKLTEGVMMIKVGRSSQVDMEEKKYRIEDAVNSCKAALDQGFVPGGGTSLVYASINSLDKSIPGQQILLNACADPIKWIANNSGFSGEVAYSKVVEENNSKMAYDANNNKICDAYENGIIDPVKVTKSALSNATSVASTLLTTNAIVSPTQEETNNSNPYDLYGY